MKHANVALFVPHAGCPHQCSFCNQRAISGTHRPLTAEDVRAAAQTALDSGVDAANAEIAFFAGSFTALSRDYMLSLLAAAKPFVESRAFSGIRISTRPDAIDDEVLRLLKAYHVTAIELGCQSMDNDVLRLNRRGHTAEDTARACRLIRTHGFELGVQMMTGLHGDTPEKALATAQRLIALSPQTARIYPTLVLAGTPLAALWRNGEYRPQTLEEAVTLCTALLCLFEQNGVRVIRLGLHAGTDFDGGLLAGPFHPALRELCDARIYLQRTLELLRDQPYGEYTIVVGRRYLSQAVGQKKENLLRLQELGYRVHFVPDAAIGQYQLNLQGTTT